MKKYKIVAKYHTGDSFGSENVEDNVELKWDNIDIAKANLKRIGEHYSFYKASNRYNLKTDFEALKKNVKKKDWCVDCNMKESYDYSLYLFDDKGKKLKYSPPWCGYFQGLHEVKIELNDPTDEDDCKIIF